MRPRTLIALTAAAAAAAVAAAAALASSAAAAPAAVPAGTNLTPVKKYLLQHTTLLTGFTRDFRAASNRYYAAAKATGFDYDTLWQTKRRTVAADVTKLKQLWVR